MNALRAAPFFLLFAMGAASADSLLIDGRTVHVDATTEIRVDDQPLPAGSLLPEKIGARLEVRLAEPVQRGGVAAAQTVVFSYALRGPVTSLTPLRVLGQELGVNASTETQGLPGGSFGNLIVGSHLDVSGYVDTNSSLLATFVEYAPEPIGRWLLSGPITAIDTGAQTANLGPQRISLAGIALQDCLAPLAVGAFVEIRADAIAGFNASSTLNSITSLTCVTPMPLGTPGALGGLHGLLDEVLSPDSFRFGPYVVTWNAATEFRFGVADDLDPGADLEIDGVFGPNLAFVAQGIQFNVPTIRLEGPVAPSDVVTGGNARVTLLGNTVYGVAQLRDEDDVYTGGITSARQVELRGYLDRGSVRFATRARTRGGPDLSSSRIGGPVEAVAAPTVTVLGITLDTSGATFEDPAGAAMTSQQFFAAIAPGALVEQTGTYDPASRRLSGGVMALILEAAPAPARSPVALAVGTMGDANALFFDGFE